MTNEEAIQVLKDWDGYFIGHSSDDVNEALNMAIKALEQEPCEDAISKQAVEKITWEEPSYTDALNALTEVREKIRALPSVTPQYTEAEIHKMQELEQDEIQKAYELGKAERLKTGHWILADEQNKEDVENDNYRFICSECQCSDIHAKGTKVPYCWNCGAKMEESEGTE